MKIQKEILISNGQYLETFKTWNLGLKIQPHEDLRTILRYTVYQDL